MTPFKTIFGQKKIGIVTSVYNSLVTDKLHEGAKKFLASEGVSLTAIKELKVPGAFEVPLGAKYLLDYEKVSGVICLGAVIEGETDHYKYVCDTTSSGLINLQMSYGVPIGFGVLTVRTLEQAIERTGGKAGNKGEEAARAVLEMLIIQEQLSNHKN